VRAMSKGGRIVQAFWSNPEDDQAQEATQPTGCMQRFVIHEGSNLWLGWCYLLSSILVYTATVFPYRLCFLEFRLGGAYPESLWLRAVEEIVNAVFYIDLSIGFFLSFRNTRGVEVIRCSQIARRYLMGMFWLNLFACLPVELLDLIMGTDSSTSSMSKGIRILRLQKLVRLLRVIKTSVRICRMTFAMQKVSKEWRVIRRRMNTRARIVGKLLFFLTTVHLFACTWYLVAALHTDPDATWVSRRGILDETPAYQWMTCMYFVVTIFTTVGFGDISGATMGEMSVVMVAMLTGIVVNSIIMGEVIDAVMKSNRTELRKSKHKELIGVFAEQTDINDDMKGHIVKWIDNSSQAVHTYEDVEALTSLLMGGGFPRHLMETLSHEVFEGNLPRNSFVIIGTGLEDPTPSLSVLLAMVCIRRYFKSGDFVYDQCDDAAEVYLVLSGTFVELFGQDCMSVGRRSTHCSMTSFEDALDVVMNVQPEPGQTLVSVSEGEPPPRPYRLWSHRNYFGELELFFARQRASAVRCEVTGSLLVLPKERMLNIMHDNPDAERRWRSAAVRRWARRRDLIKESYTRSPDIRCHEMAAIMIQRWMRSFLSTSVQKTRITFNVEVPASTPERLCRMEDRLEKIESLLFELLANSDRRRSMPSSLLPSSL